MYKNFRKGFKSRTNYSALSRSFNSGRKTIQVFDPSNIVKEQSEVNEKQYEYKIQNKFSDFEIVDKLKQNIISKNYQIPTPIQDRAIPEILRGSDIIGIANTGTGKTAAFLIPLLDKVYKDKYKKVLIVAPTRELASQIKNEFHTFSKGLNIFSTLCIGGESINRQKNELRKNPKFIIGTPGRIMDHIKTNTLNLSDCTSVVLDEADHMVDIGFLKDVKYIISQLPKVRQSLFFSATIDGKVREILNSFVNNPVTISVKNRETSANVKQETIKCFDPREKIEILTDLLKKPEFKKVLIFARTKHGVQKLSDTLLKRGFRVDAIHGNKRQNQRLKTLDKFKRNNINILIATDVASRGLDINGVSHVINYEAPENKDTYVHRIGRTGRADNQGVAITFI